jgi:hypothetical protein
MVEHQNPTKFYGVGIEVLIFPLNLKTPFSLCTTITLETTLAWLMASHIGKSSNLATFACQALGEPCTLLCD